MMMARRPIIGGNWKCNPAAKADLDELIKNFNGCGAFTGEMAVEQMKDLGLVTVLIGHSERRGEFGIFPMDTDDTLATKLKYILDAGMTCAYCVGEPKDVREKGLEAVLAYVDVQLT